MALGFGDTAYSGLIGSLSSSLMFLVLIVIGLFYRKKIQIHKRLMLLGTLVLLWPAWFRFRHFFPEVPRPEFWFAIVLADIWIIIAWIYEWKRYRTIHPTLLYIGIFIILEHIFELVTFDSPIWRELAIFIHSSIS
ncbi:MAG: hypothetical protein R2809_09840 [Flavobacteriales bacterium]